MKLSKTLFVSCFLLLFFNIQMFAPSFKMSDIMKRRIREEYMKTNNCNEIKTKHITRKECAALLEPWMNIVNDYSKYFPNLKQEELRALVRTLFVSESSNSKGVGKSPLFIDGNNGFGMQGYSKNSKLYNTFEQKNKVNYDTVCYFMHFNNIDSSIHHLFNAYFLKPYFKRVRQSKNLHDAFNKMYLCGYMTAADWPGVAYNIAIKNKLIY